MSNFKLKCAHHAQACSHCSGQSKGSWHTHVIFTLLFNQRVVAVDQLPVRALDGNYGFCAKRAHA